MWPGEHEDAGPPTWGITQGLAATHVPTGDHAMSQISAAPNSVAGLLALLLIGGRIVLRRLWPDWLRAGRRASS